MTIHWAWFWDFMKKKKILSCPHYLFKYPSLAPHIWACQKKFNLFPIINSNKEHCDGFPDIIHWQCQSVQRRTKAHGIRRLVRCWFFLFFRISSLLSYLFLCFVCHFEDFVICFSFTARFAIDVKCNLWWCFVINIQK